VLPIFMSLTEGLGVPQVRRIVLQSVIVAMIVGLVFLAVGKGVLQLLGISVADFMIAGGALLFILSVRDLLTVEKGPWHLDAESLGAVPIGVPLIVGPAVLTTTLLLMDAHGLLPTASALIVNIVLAGVVFLVSGSINRLLGRTGAKTVSKVASLLLAAIAVMIVRKGIERVIRGPG